MRGEEVGRLEAEVPAKEHRVLAWLRTQAGPQLKAYSSASYLGPADQILNLCPPPPTYNVVALNIHMKMK